MTEHHGLTTFYGLERLIKQHYRRERDREATRRAAGVFWIHTISFAIYNVLFGYLLMHRERPAISGLVVYGTAIGLHFLVTDYGLRRDHRADYDRIVRWVLAAAVLFGWYLLDHSAQLGISAIFSVLAGGIVLNVIKRSFRMNARAVSQRS